MTNRLTFTIKNKDGRVVGFGGRQMDESKNGPKYINTPETEYFKKSELLFGLYEAKNAIYREKEAIIVEGYVDTVILHQEGVSNTVAVMGASANEAAFDSIWKITKRLIFCLDGDSAGRTGTYRSIMHAAEIMKDDNSIGIAKLPDGMDPDEFVLEFGADAFKNLVKQAVPLSKFLCETQLELANKNGVNIALDSVEGRAKYLMVMQDVASKFQSAHALRLEIQREANATVNAYVINAALRRYDINFTPNEVVNAIEMLSALAPPNSVGVRKQITESIAPIEQMPNPHMERSAHVKSEFVEEMYEGYNNNTSKISAPASAHIPRRVPMFR